MSITKSSIATKLAIGAIGVAFVFGLMFASTVPAQAALTTSQVDAIISLLQSFGADATTIANVQASLTGGTPTTGGGTSTASVCPYTWSTSLTSGSSGADVMALQKFLNSDSATTIASSGVGSAGNETDYFGSLTKAAVVKFQDKYASEVLTPVGLSVGTGYFGSSSRAKANALCAVATTPTTPTTPETPTTPAPTGTGLSVVGGVQPTATLAPDSANRVPFTTFVVTAGSDGDVVMNNVTIERVGLAANAVFAGIVLLDSDGTQYGLAKTLNSNNQAKIGEAVTIPAGTSKTFTVAGNMAADNSTRDGQVAQLNVIAVNTSATLSGSLPIAGTAQTINATLAIGTATAERGALDPNANASKEVGTTNYTFAGIKVTAGSAEEITVKSIRWNQSGTASVNDLANVVVVFDGTEYPTVVSADGKYYTANFGAGITIGKGLAKEISIKGDIDSGSARTVIFDIYKNTDLYMVGNTFGYGITATTPTTATAATTSSQFTTGTPWYDNATVTVGTGSLNVSSTNDVPAGNVADGASNASLGSFEFDVRGEPVTWSSIALTIATTSGSGTDGGELLTNVTLVDANGSIIAGPQDPNAAGSTVTISDTITLPVGKNIITVKGNLNNSWENNDTIIVSFTPSTAITSITGDTSSQTVTPTPATAVTAKTQTVKAGSLTVTPSSSLVAQNVIDNSSNVVLGRYVLDASASGENVKVTTIQIEGVTGTNADIDELNSLYIYDVTNGANTNITASNVNNPSGNTGGADKLLSFTVDSGALEIVKGTQRIIELRGSVNASSTPTSTTTFTMDFADGTLASDWTVTGVDTGKAITETLNTTAGAALTVVAAGTLTASLDSSSPAEKWLVSGAEPTLGVFKFVAVNEDMAITDLALQIDTASSSAADFVSISLWNGATKIQELSSPAFNSSTQTFTFDKSGTNSFVVPKGDDGAKLTVKAKLPGIGTNLPGTSGNLVKIATSTTATQNKASGVNSGTAVNILGSAATSTGARYFKSVPTVEKLSLSSNVLGNGTKSLYKFKVSADAAGDIDLYKFSFTIATTSANADSFQLIETDTGKTVFSSIQSAAGIVEGVVANAQYGSTFITIPKGTSHTYELKATITNAGTAGDAVTVTMDGDAAHLSATTNGLSAANVDGDTNDDFIWSDRSNSSHTISTADWYNGYKVPGLPVTNLDAEVIAQ